MIVFEDCPNQWSLSRPLLALVLTNEDVFNQVIGVVLGLGLGLGYRIRARVRGIGLAASLTLTLTLTLP